MWCGCPQRTFASYSVADAHSNVKPGSQSTDRSICDPSTVEELLHLSDDLKLVEIVIESLHNRDGVSQ